MNAASALAVSNSILVSTTPSALYVEAGQGVIRGDFNLFWMASSGTFATNSKKQVTYLDLRQWQEDDRDLQSMIMDPMFVDPTAGNFHLQSREGYWNNGSWTNSLDTSWGIDAGDPASLAYTNEPDPDGGR